MKKVKVGIIGGAGYTGGELLRLLVNHPGVEITLVTSESFAKKKVSDEYPNLKGSISLTFENYRKERTAACEFIFLAKPQPNSFSLVKDLFNKVRIIDLSGDFRFSSAKEFEFWYHTPHLAPKFLKEAVYGLPELFGNEIKRAKLVANPGCYPTGIILATFPLAKEGLLEPEVDASAVSGFSGAGRTPSPNSMAYSVAENIRPYKIGVHPHTGEVEAIIKRVTGKALRLNFVPQVAGFERGILSVIFLRMKKKISPELVAGLYRKSYRSCPFVRILREGTFPEIKSAAFTNFCDLGWHLSGEKTLLVITALDNLVKGAAGQAIQNLNLMAGFPEESGLK
ncbi:MAG: N-acetyl-gamma-glutamyl-phosphate reductase [Candidatus Omnitrophota bacterium]